MRRLVIFFFITMFAALTVHAQRKTDPLDRGLVAVKKASGVFCSWRILAEEYYDVKYNIYRNGTKLNSEPLNVSNYTDASGTESNTYTVRAVVNGVEQDACAAVTPWNTGRVDKTSKTFACPAYLPIKVADVTDRAGTVVWKNENGTVTSTQKYIINDISLGDVDGDGKIDFIVKRNNQTDKDNLFPTDNTTAFCRIEVYTSKKNYQLSWYIDCGPNTVYGSDEQWDAVAFDWDLDGKCEVLYRAYANTIIHKADGSTVTIGSANENIRPYVNHVANQTFTNCGSEYLVYMDGETGSPYVTMDYPLKRLESSEYSTSIDWTNSSDINSKITAYKDAVNTAWGDNYGHRSSKYFMGAPYLDGRKPSIYLGRGIYTRHKMIAYDVDPTSHALTEKWTWSNNTSGSDWFGQGYHNYCIADVDEDGRDEIVYGSMVIDDNGKGLSTTGLGHGDASHTSDLDPFRKGLETFACNEDEPGNNFRNAATCDIYYRYESASDDGRCMAGNFSNDYPGSLGGSSADGVIALSSKTPKLISGLFYNWNDTKVSITEPFNLNGRIYWDGDLLEESVNSPGTERECVVHKMGSGRIMQTSGAAMNNNTKNNPCAQGDIIGDWREELILRSADNTEFRIYSTTDETQYRIPSLWFDHQYRQAMVWQSEGYNQPPHASFFLGELEGITQAPPVLTNSGKTEIAADASITSATDGQDLLIVVEPSKSTNKRYAITLDGAIAPKSLTINSPTIVSGNDNNSSITSTTYSCNIGYTNNGTFSGSMRLIKQGEGHLLLPNKTMTHTGMTEIWGGSVTNEKGTISSSKVWMNRHTTLNTSNGIFNGGIEMNYNSTININVASDGKRAVNASDLKYNYGSRIVVDVNSASDATLNDQINVSGTLTIVTKDWQYGPKYLAPVLEVNSTETLDEGTYEIGTIGSIDGNIDDIIIECNNLKPGVKTKLIYEDGKLYLNTYDDTEYIGNKDNSTDWWSAFSDSYTIESGYNYNFKFTNYGNSDENYHNWLLVVANGSGHSTSERSDYAEHFVLRADNYGWGGGYNESNLSNNYDWNSFKTDMQDAEVDMNIKFVDGILRMDANITCASGKNYTYSFYSNKINADNVTIFYTVDHSHMTIPEMIKETIDNQTEPSNVVGSTTTYDFKNWESSDCTLTIGTTQKGTAYSVYPVGQQKIFQVTAPSSMVEKFAFQGTANTTTDKGAILRSGYGLGMINANRSGAILDLTAGTVVKFYIADTTTYPIDFTGGGTDNGTWNVESIDGGYKVTMLTAGNLGFCMAKGAYNTADSYITKIEITSPSSLTLSPTTADTYDTGIYGSVTLNRNFSAGYSTLCVPFNTTVSELTNDDSEAYVAYLSGVTKADGNLYALKFKKTQEIVANKPYILYLSKALSAPTVTNKPVYSENAKTLIADDWSMTGNYEASKSVASFYTVGTSAINKETSTQDGFTAYLTGTLNSQVSSLVLSSDGDYLFASAVVTASVAAGRKFGTFSSLYNVDFKDASNEDIIAAYTAKYIPGTNSVRLTRHRDVLPAGTGVILYAPESTKSQTFATVATTTATVGDNDLVGTPVATYIDKTSNTTIYGLSGDAFHPQSKAGTVPAGKAYLAVSNSSAKEITLNFDDESTGISESRDDTGFFGNGKIYNLQGIEVTAPERGKIYIVNGKKLMMK